MNSRVKVPGSKSHTQRALILAATATSPSIIRDPSTGDDSTILVQLLRRSGVSIEERETTGCTELMVNPPARLVLPPSVFSGDGASVARFLSPLTHFAGHEVTITGSQQLSARPMGELGTALTNAGFIITWSQRDGHLPLRISGGFTTSEVTLTAATSSQHVSALLLAAPRLPRGLAINVVGPVVSRGYITMTLQTMEQFGILVATRDRGWCVPQSSFAGAIITMEPDWSLWPFVIIASHLKSRPCEPPPARQADARFMEHWQRLLGSEPDLQIHLTDTPDLLPPLAVGAALLERRVRFTGISHAALKESDRLGVLVRELKKAGTEARFHDGVLALTAHHPSLGALNLCGEGDHRMIMALSLFALRQPVSMNDTGAVRKSWPGYFEEMKKVGLPW